MTHKDIYTKFMIEYDKANVTSSYPSLTEYEIATVLDKAYNALIAQKITGNNVRRVGFEMDVKAISDLAPLIQHRHIAFFEDAHVPTTNVASFKLPSDFDYYVQAYIEYSARNNNHNGIAAGRIIDDN
jgi:uracil phosphoribosyltransferase